MPTRRRLLLSLGMVLSVLLVVPTAVLAIFMGLTGGASFIPTDNRQFIVSFDELKLEIGYYSILTVIDPDPLISATPAEMKQPNSFLDGHPSPALPANWAYPAVRWLHRPPANYRPTGRNVHVFVVGPQITLPYWFLLCVELALPARGIWRSIFG